MKIKDYYKILGVETTASGEDIKKAYHNLARIYHPDANPDLDTVSKFQEISEAYQMIGNLENRLKYRMLLLEKEEISEQAKVLFNNRKRKQNKNK